MALIFWTIPFYLRDGKINRNQKYKFLQVPHASRHDKPYVYIEDWKGWGFPMMSALLAGALVLLNAEVKHVFDNFVLNFNT